MRIPLLLAAALLASCANPQPPVSIQPIARVDLKPVKDRVERVADSGSRVDKSLETTRDRLDAAIVDAHQAKIDAAAIDANLQAAKASLTEAMEERKRQADEIQFLKVEVDQAQGKEDAANLAANSAVTRANTAEGKVYKYELQEKEDEGNWGLNGVWRWIRYLGWHVIILVVIIAAITMALRIFAPLTLPIFTGIWRVVLLAGRGFWSIVSRLWRKSPP